MSETPIQPQNQNSEIEDLADTKPEVILDLTILEPGRLKLRAALRTDIGAVRQINEDSCLIYTFDSGGHYEVPSFGLYLVADGMGGHDGGERASKIAARTAANHLLQQLYLPLLRDEPNPDDDQVEQIMRASVFAAHKAVHPANYTGNGGTTLTVAVVLGHQLHVAHVGDSRAYWLVDNKLEALTRDHSLVQRLQDTGKLTAQEAENYQYRNVLLRALGQEEDLEVDTYLYELPPHGKLLLCSDGLCGHVSDEEIQHIMRQPLSCVEAANHLVQAALNAGGSDNISAIVVVFDV